MTRQTLFLILTLSSSNIATSQISTTKIKEAKPVLDQTPYDSTDNFLGINTHKYIGQELYLKGKAESLRKYGYDKFVKDYKKPYLTNTKNVYKCCDGYNSKYDELAGKYFTVLAVIPHPKAKENKALYGSKFFLKLKEKESGDIVYNEYNAGSKYSFPFIVVGYFEKSKTRYIGTEYVLRGRNWEDKKLEMYDIQTGKSVDFSAGTIWKCVDFTIEEKYYELSLILESSKGERLAYSMSNVWKGTYFGFPKSDADKYKEKFSADNWYLILAGKVKIGMTTEMCELSWGKPKDINQTITEGKNTEQWVYSDNYLYFDNGILSAMQ